MKKMRPAFRVTCIGSLDKREELGDIILRYSTSIGLRWYETQRMTLRRSIGTFESSLGPVAMKRSRWGDEIVRTTPEYEDIRKIAHCRNDTTGNVRAKIMSEFLSKEK